MSASADGPTVGSAGRVLFVSLAWFAVWSVGVAGGCPCCQLVHFTSPFLVYHELVHTTKLYVYYRSHALPSRPSARPLAPRSHRPCAHARERRCSAVVSAACARAVPQHPFFRADTCGMLRRSHRSRWSSSAARPSPKSPRAAAALPQRMPLRAHPRLPPPLSGRCFGPSKHSLSCCPLYATPAAVRPPASLSSMAGLAWLVVVIA